MRGKNWGVDSLRFAILVGVLSCAPAALGQVGSAAPGAANTGTPSDMATMKEMIGKLQSQVQELAVTLDAVRADQAGARSEIGALRRALSESDAKLAALSGMPAGYPTVAAAPPPSSNAAPAAVESISSVAHTGAKQTGTESQPAYDGDALSSLLEDQQLANSKLSELSQSKVESGSKYRLRLSGIVLLNLFSSTGQVDNTDFPQFAIPQTSPAFDANNTFGGTLRQSQIRVQTFGPDIAGAHTSADLKFDFAGGFPDAPNGVNLGIARLRTGTVRFDWANTSIVAGQDLLFFAPLVPTSLASLATPALSYSGNLWGWTPQVRVEHTHAFSESAKLLIEGGILDSLTGDIPVSQSDRTATWGEQSGQPAYAGRVAFTHAMFGREFTIGTGAYFGPQSWGFGRRVNGWASTADLLVPIGQKFEVSAEFFRGNAIGGLGGGIGQTVLWQGSFLDPVTTIHGLDSVGGWMQVKFKPTPKFQINGALGIDSPFASELRNYGGNPYYENLFFSRNLTPQVNFIYQPRSDVLFSIEYRRLNTAILDGRSSAANQSSFSVGYLF